MLDFIARHFWRIWAAIYAVSFLALAVIAVAQFFGWRPA